MNNKIWYGLAVVASILLGVLFYLGYTYYKLKAPTQATLSRNGMVITTTYPMEEMPVELNGEIFCFDIDCNLGFRSDDGKEYSLSVQNVNRSEDLTDGLRVHIIGTINTREKVDSQNQILTLITYEKI